MQPFSTISATRRRRWGALEDAAASYSTVVRIRPDFATAWFNLGNVRKELGQISPVITALETATRLKPDYAEAFSNLGVRAHRSGPDRRRYPCV